MPNFPLLLVHPRAHLAGTFTPPRLLKRQQPGIMHRSVIISPSALILAFLLVLVVFADLASAYNTSADAASPAMLRSQLYNVYGQCLPLSAHGLGLDRIADRSQDTSASATPPPTRASVAADKTFAPRLRGDTER